METTRRVRLAVALLAALLVGAPAPSLAQTVISQGDVVVGNVTDIINPTTIQLDSGQRVHLAGLDSIQPARNVKQRADFAQAAMAHMASLLKGRRIWLQFDRTRVADDGAFLAYVYLLPDGTFANAELIKNGYARTFTSHEFYYTDAFLDLERAAQKSNDGLWARIPKASSLRQRPRSTVESRTASAPADASLDNATAGEKSTVAGPPDPLRLFNGKDGAKSKSTARASSKTTAKKAAFVPSPETPKKAATASVADDDTTTMVSQPSEPGANTPRGTESTTTTPATDPGARNSRSTQVHTTNMARDAVNEANKPHDR